MTRQIDSELRILLDAVCDETLTDERCAALEARLVVDPEARRLLLQYVQLHLALDFAYRGERTSEKAFGKLGIERPISPEAKPSASPILGFLNKLPTAIHPGRHPSWFVAAAVTLTAVFWGVLVLVVWPGSQREPAAGRVPAVAESPDRMPPGFVATILHAEEVVWAAGAPPLRQGMFLAAGQRLQLESGLVQVLFADGARTVVEGPAVLVIDSERATTLETGRLLARAPPPARGFTVTTPIVDLVDLGTEFGVAVAAQSVEVQVFEGTIEARRHGGDAEEPARQLIAGSATEFGNSPQLGFYVKEKKMNRMTYTALAAVLTLPLADDVAHAVPIPVPNFSFETPTQADGSNVNTTVDGDTTTIPGWQFGRTAGGSIRGGVFNPTDTNYSGASGDTTPLPAPAEGFQVAFLDFTLGATGTETLTSQSSLATIQDNSIYTLSVATGRRLNDVAISDISITLLADGTPIPGAVATIQGDDITLGTFVDLTASFTTMAEGDPLAGQALAIQLSQTNLTSEPGVAVQVHFDNVRLNATELPVVPEPATSAILGGGGLVLLGLRRRKRRRR